MTAEGVRRYGIWNGAVVNPRQSIVCKWFTKVVDESELGSVQLAGGDELVLLTPGMLYLLGAARTMHMHGMSDVEPADHPTKIGMGNPRDKRS